MNIMNRNMMMRLTTLALFLVTSGMALAQQPIEGVFGLKDGEGIAAIAFWVPLSGDESISGVRWFNNDGSVVFPEVLAVAGDHDQPELLADAVVVAVEVSGETLAASELTFDQPLASSAEGLYLIWMMPEAAGFEETGTGPGFGYLVGETENRCWLSGDGSTWEPFTVTHQMAMAAVMNTDKSSDVLVLDKPGSDNNEASPETESGTPGNLAINLQVSPNPFNPTTEIKFNLPRSGAAEVAVYDVKGRRVRRIWNGHLEIGRHEMNWNGKTDRGNGASSGVYLLRVSGAGFEASRTITLLK